MYPPQAAQPPSAPPVRYASTVDLPREEPERPLGVSLVTGYDFLLATVGLVAGVMGVVLGIVFFIEDANRGRSGADDLAIGLLVGVPSLAAAAALGVLGYANLKARRWARTGHVFSGLLQAVVASIATLIFLGVMTSEAGSFFGLIVLLIGAPLVIVPILTIRYYLSEPVKDYFYKPRVRRVWEAEPTMNPALR